MPSKPLMGDSCLTPEDGAYEHFKGNMADRLLGFLSEGGRKKQVVGQAELLPCLVARHLWGERMKGRPVLHFIGNEAARYALIKGSSPTLESAWLIASFWGRESSI